MHILSNLDGKTIFAGICIIFMVVVLIKGMGTKAGGAGGNGKSNNSNNTSNSNNSGNNAQ